MKMLLGLMVVLIIIVGFYYFYLADTAQAPQENGASAESSVTIPTQPTKYIPPGTVMEDGTI